MGSSQTFDWPFGDWNFGDSTNFGLGWAGKAGNLEIHMEFGRSFILSVCWSVIDIIVISVISIFFFSPSSTIESTGKTKSKLKPYFWLEWCFLKFWTEMKIYETVQNEIKLSQALNNLMLFIVFYILFLIKLTGKQKQSWSKLILISHQEIFYPNLAQKVSHW